MRLSALLFFLSTASVALVIAAPPNAGANRQPERSSNHEVREYSPIPDVLNTVLVTLNTVQSDLGQRPYI